MSNQGSVQSAAEQQQLAIQSGQLGPLAYVGKPVFDASPAAQEIYLGGIEGARLNIPTDSCITGMLVFSAWNITDGDAPAGAVIFFSAENDGGTVAVTPTNIRATDGNPINEFDNGVGTIALAADDTNKAIVLNFTGTANDTYDVQATLYYAISGANFRRPNAYGTTS